MQRPITPTSVWAAIDEGGRMTRLFQIFLGVLSQNTVPVTSLPDGTLTSGLVLLRDDAVIPQGWTQVDTLVIGLNTYKVIGLE
jgi:hypothetical protein